LGVASKTSIVSAYITIVAIKLRIASVFQADLGICLMEIECHLHLLAQLSLPTISLYLD